MPQQPPFLSVTGPSIKPPLQVTSFEGREALCQLFHFTLLMASPDPALDAAIWLGKPARFTISVFNGGTRHIEGIFRSLHRQGGTITYAEGEPVEGYAYTAELVPTLYRLCLRRSGYVFEGRTPLEIVETILRDHELPGVEPRLSAKPAAVPLALQYRENDFEFLARVLSESGLVWFFEESSKVLVIGDSAEAYRALNVDGRELGIDGFSTQEFLLPDPTLPSHRDASPFIHATCDEPRLAPGRSFSYNGDFLVIQAEHSGTDAAAHRGEDDEPVEYENRIGCLRLETPFLDLDKKAAPVVAGVLPAVVASAESGAVKVKLDPTLGCGLQGDTAFTVRSDRSSLKSGQTVWLSFIEGHPDRPIIVG